MGVLNGVNLFIFHVNVSKVEDTEGHVVEAGDEGDKEDHDEVVEGWFLWICSETSTQ